MNKLFFLFLSILLIGNCEKTSPPLEYFPDMYDSPAIETNEADIFGAESREKAKPGFRIPPDGTIPVGYYPYVYADVLTPDDLKNPEKGLPFPESIKKTRANYEKGESRFQIFCSPCHGYRGLGNGSVVGPSPRFSFPPPSLMSDKIKGWTDGQIYHIVTKGRGLMGSYSAQIDPDDRWKLILYIRKLQENSK